MERPELRLECARTLLERAGRGDRLRLPIRSPEGPFWPPFTNLLRFRPQPAALTSADSFESFKLSVTYLLCAVTKKTTTCHSSLAYHHIAINPYLAAQHNVFLESTHFAVRRLPDVTNRWKVHLSPLLILRFDETIIQR
jgi:hypothetical protein